VSVAEFWIVKEYLPPVAAEKTTFGDKTAGESVIFTYKVPLSPAAGVAVKVIAVAVPAGELTIAEVGLNVSAAAAGGCDGGEGAGEAPPPPPHPVRQKEPTRRQPQPDGHASYFVSSLTPQLFFCVERGNCLCALDPGAASIPRAQDTLRSSKNSTWGNTGGCIGTGSAARPDFERPSDCAPGFA
jgi:hypothetical protein